MQVPELRYARSGDLRLAFQEFGAGPPLLIIPALLSNMEVAWEHEFIMRIFDLLSKHVNVVQFDKRGIGLSDRTDTAPTLEERIGDIVAVMDAVGWQRASLLGISEGGLMAQLFAATYPERVDKLILHNTIVSSRYYDRLGALVEPAMRPLIPVKRIGPVSRASPRDGRRTPRNSSTGSCPINRATKHLSDGSAGSSDCPPVHAIFAVRSKASSSWTRETRRSGLLRRRW